MIDLTVNSIQTKILDSYFQVSERYNLKTYDFN